MANEMLAIAKRILQVIRVEPMDFEALPEQLKDIPWGLSDEDINEIAPLLIQDVIAYICNRVKGIVNPYPKLVLELVVEATGDSIGDSSTFRRERQGFEEFRQVVLELLEKEVW